MPEKKRLETLTKEDLIKLHEIVEPIKDPETGKIVRWKGVKKASDHFGVTRQTITNSWLAEHPESPVRRPRKGIKPKVVEDFEKTEAWNRIKEHKYANTMKTTLLQGWIYTGQIDPYTWDAELYKALRETSYKGKENPLYDTMTGDISTYHATNIRRAIKAFEREDTQKYLTIMEDVAKRTALRREWYLKTEEIPRLIEKINELDTLIFARKCLEDGSRPIATAGKRFKDGRPIPKILRFTKDKILKDRNAIQRYETKKKTYALAKYQPETISMILRYCRDMGVGETEDVLPRNQITYSSRIKSAGKKAGIPVLKRKGFGAYAFRHTMATQALKHGVSIEVVANQGAWETMEIIKKYYAGLDEEKQDFELLDIKPKKKLHGDNGSYNSTRYLKTDITI